MFQPEYDPSECTTCTTCAACTRGIHSCCMKVRCVDNSSRHRCNCMSHLHEKAAS